MSLWFRKKKRNYNHTGKPINHHKKRKKKKKIKKKKQKKTKKKKKKKQKKKKKKRKIQDETSNKSCAQHSFKPKQTYTRTNPKITKIGTNRTQTQNKNS